MSMIEGVGLISIIMLFVSLTCSFANIFFAYTIYKKTAKALKGWLYLTLFTTTYAAAYFIGAILKEVTDPIIRIIFLINYALVLIYLIFTY